MSKNIRKLFAIFLLTVIVFSTSCDNSEFQKEIGEFQTAMDDSRSALESYYLEMNQFERDLYILRRETDPNSQLSLLYADNGERLLPGREAMYVNGPFRPKSIKARLDSLKLIGLYAKRLAELTGTDSPAVFETNTAAIGQNLSNLANTFNNLAGSGTDPTAAGYFAPISKLVGIVGRLYLERKRDKALVASVRQGSGYVTKITSLLKIDFAEVISPIRRSGLRVKISTLVANYENVRAALSRKERSALLAEINGVVRTYELFTVADTVAVIQSMEDANQALLRFANSGMHKSGFTQVVARIGEFRDRAKQIAEILKEIKEIRREIRDANG